MALPLAPADPRCSYGNFINLPHEVRDNIWRHLLSSRQIIAKSPFNREPVPSATSDLSPPKPPSTNIFYTSKPLSAEASDVLYRESWMVVKTVFPTQGFARHVPMTILAGPGGVDFDRVMNLHIELQMIDLDYELKYRSTIGKYCDDSLSRISGSQIRRKSCHVRIEKPVTHGDFIKVDHPSSPKLLLDSPVGRIVKRLNGFEALTLEFTLTAPHISGRIAIWNNNLYVEKIRLGFVSELQPELGPCMDCTDQFRKMTPGWAVRFQPYKYHEQIEEERVKNRSHNK